MTETSTFTSTTPYDNPHVAAVAVYCSDGRFIRQTQQFLYDSLHLHHCDHVAIPGGPATLASPDIYADSFEQLIFLVNAHDLEKIILIAHEDCGFYKAILNLVGQNQIPQQISDIKLAIQKLHQTKPSLIIEPYMASITNNSISFSPITT